MGRPSLPSWVKPRSRPERAGEVIASGPGRSESRVTPLSPPRNMEVERTAHVKAMVAEPEVIELDAVVEDDELVAEVDEEEVLSGDASAAEDVHVCVHPMCKNRMEHEGGAFWCTLPMGHEGPHEPQPYSDGLSRRARAPPKRLSDEPEQAKKKGRREPRAEEDGLSEDRSRLHDTVPRTSQQPRGNITPNAKSSKTGGQRTSPGEPRGCVHASPSHPPLPAPLAASCALPALHLTRCVSSVCAQLSDRDAAGASQAICGRTL